MKLLSVLLLTFSLRLVSEAGWVRVDVGATGNSEVVLEFKPEQEATLADALGQLGAGRFKLKHLSSHTLVLQPGFQQELRAILEQDAPKELADALASGGNVHNPKLASLNRVLNSAILKTPTVQQIDAALAPFGLQVTEASHEKLTITRHGNTPSIRCFLWLVVAPK